MRPHIGARKLLMPGLMVPEVHQNDRSYVRELSGLSIQDAKIYHGGLHGVQTSLGVGACLGQYSNMISSRAGQFVQLISSISV